jgi:hypothetical protein
MKKTFVSRSREHGREHGITMILVAAAMVAIIGMAVLSIDVVTLYLAKEEAQRSADAAALAAARLLSVSGITGDPANLTSNWGAVCGASGTATLVAQAVAHGHGHLFGWKRRDSWHRNLQLRQPLHFGVWREPDGDRKSDTNWSAKLLFSHLVPFRE